MKRGKLGKDTKKTGYITKTGKNPMDIYLGNHIAYTYILKKSKKEKVMKEIETLRDEIDLIDDKMVQLFEKRVELAIRIGAIKRKNSIEITDSEREKDIMKMVVARLKNKDFSVETEELFKNIIKLSKKVQQKMADKVL